MRYLGCIVSDASVHCVGCWAFGFKVSGLESLGFKVSGFEFGDRHCLAGYMPGGYHRHTESGRRSRSCSSIRYYYCLQQ